MSNIITVDFELNEKTLKQINSALRSAVYSDSFEMAELYIKLGADVTSNNNEIINTATLYADFENEDSIKIVELLLENGADPNAMSSSCLISAIENNKEEWIDLFIKYNYDMNGKFDINEKPLYHAAINKNVCFVKKLIKAGAKAEETYPFIDSIIEMGDISIVEELFDNENFDVNQMENIMLVMASRYNKIDIIEYLIKKGANVQSENNLPIKTACYCGSIETMKTLIKLGADVRVDNDCLICDAAKEGNFDVVAVLIKLGLDPNANNGEPLRNAFFSMNKDVVSLLRISMNMDVDEETKNRIMNRFENIN